MLSVYTRCDDCGQEVPIPHLCPLSGHPEITARLRALEAVVRDVIAADGTAAAGIERASRLLIILAGKARAALALGRTP